MPNSFLESFEGIVENDSIRWDIIYAGGALDITSYIIRAEIWHGTDIVKLANDNQAGGATNQIEITDGPAGAFTIKVAAGATSGMRGPCSLEIEIELTDGQIITIYQIDFTIHEEKINWQDPTA